MAKMYFGKTVRYEGIEYPPKEIDDDKEPEDDKEEKSELDILREKALELGIDFKGNWGVKKLTEAITEAEQA